MEKFILIEESVDAAHRKYLFNSICEDILHLTPHEVKKQYLKYEGNSLEIARKVPSMDDILGFCDKYGIKFSVKLSWDDSEEFKLLSKGSEKSYERTENHKDSAMEEAKEVILSEAKEITNPELTPAPKYESPPLTEARSVNLNKLPNIQL